MIAVRYVALAALAVWLGGMSVLVIVVAPSIFRTLQALDPSVGNVQAGVVFGEALRSFHILAYTCGAIVLVCLFVMKFVGPPPRAFKLRAVIVGLMLAIAVYSGVPLTREITGLQTLVAGPINTLPATDPLRARFERLHTTSVTLMAVNMLLGYILLIWHARD